MEVDIFSYQSYQEYLLAWIASQPKRGRGARAALARAARAPLSHVSQVLGGISDLSFEQAEEMNEFLGHAADEADYFLLLVQFARAGTPRLKNRITRHLQKLREKQLILKDRLDVKNSLSNEDQALFYSSWHYAAVHILLTIPEFQTKEAIAKYFGLSLKRTSEILNFLSQLGLARQDHGRFTVGTTRIHLGSDSPMISKHHINWRLQAIQALEKESSSEGLHYSSVVSISKADALEIKSRLVKAIENAKALIRDSKEEELHSLCLDFFRL